MPYIYYGEQCGLCLKKGKCTYEKNTRHTIDAIRNIEKIASNVYGCFSFKCDYFDLNEVEYEKKNPPVYCG